MGTGTEGNGREPIAVIGTGYVGLVTAAGFAELGSDVWCVDVDADKVATLQRGEIPIFEPGLEELVAKNRDRLHFSTDLAPALEHARLLFVAVGTPPTYSGDADLSAVYAVVDAMPASDRHALVMKSTVPVGTGASIQRRFYEAGKAGFRYVSCPEFLREGTAVHDFLNPDRVVIGDARDWAGDAVVALYEPLDAPVVRTDIASAEMVKMASNAFLSTKISFINEIANVCEETGADVTEVARGMGLDDRIGPKFLQAGIGYGGSCLVGDETVLVRLHRRTTLMRFEDLWRRLENEGVEELDGMLEPDDLEVLSWVPEWDSPRFLPVMAVFRRHYEDEVLEVRTKMGRRLRCTPDHPLIVGDGRGGEPEIKLARDVGPGDWLPLAQGQSDKVDREGRFLMPTVAAVEEAGLELGAVLVRPPREHIDGLLARPPAERVFAHARGGAQRSGDVKRTGVLRLDELYRADIPLLDCGLATAKNGNYFASEVIADPHFWRVVGLYVAEGFCSVSSRKRSPNTIIWSFHRTREQHLVDEVVAFWLKHGIRARPYLSPTSSQVLVSSRVATFFWTRILGLGRTSYEQRLPDLIWQRPAADKWALLSGLWEGDGSWSLVNGGPSAILEFGTISDELADGVMRLLGDLEIVCSRRVGRVSKSTKDTHWLRVSGADQIERAIGLVPCRDRPGVLAALARQRKRIKPTGYRKFESRAPAWARVTDVHRQSYTGPVFSLEVPTSHKFVASGSLIIGNCFPKDVTALKQLAGNSGYHFQLLNAVIEVNELQKRRVIGKLQKHLGPLVGKTVTLLGLAFKPDTDDMREASSLVLAARLQAEGANVRGYDPVAEEEARSLMPAVEFAPSALDAVEGADAVVLVTEWKEFRELDWKQVAENMAGDLVVDGRNALDPAIIRAAGLDYEGVGRR